MRLIVLAEPPPGLQLHLLDVDADPTPYERLEAQAGDAACERVARLRAPLQRRRLLVREIAVRRLAAERLGRAVDDIRIVRAPSGRPAVEGGGLALSLSHSRGLALIAFANGGEVGCDLEHRDAAVDWRDARDADVLTDAEARSLESLSRPEEAQALFLRMWTLKEAALKCLGVGLSVPARCIRTCGPVSDAEGDGSPASLLAAVPALRPDCAVAVAWRFSN